MTQTAIQVGIMLGCNKEKQKEEKRDNSDDLSRLLLC